MAKINKVYVVLNQFDKASGIRSFCDDIIKHNLFKDVDFEFINTSNAIKKLRTKENKKFYYHELFNFNTLIFFFLNIFFNNKIVLVSHGNFVLKKYTASKIKKYIFYSILSLFDTKNNYLQYLSEAEMNKSFKPFKQTFICPPSFPIIDDLTKVSNDLTLNKDDINLVYIAAFKYYRKGFDILFDIKNWQVNTKIHIVGPEKDEIKNFIPNELKSNIILHGRKSREWVLANIAKFDYTMLLSRSEGFPISLIESIIYKTPIIVSEGTNFKFFVNSYKLGFDIEDVITDPSVLEKSFTIENELFKEEVFNEKYFENLKQNLFSGLNEKN